jgi:ketosteroid isomerase-like protein
MSEENVEVVRQAVAAFIEGDYERLIELSDPQIEYDVSRTSPESRVVRGREEVLAVLEEWVDTWDEHQAELVELIDAGEERVVGVIYERGKLKGSDAWVEHPRGIVYTLRDQRVLRYEEHEHRAQALEAAGLRGVSS